MSPFTAGVILLSRFLSAWFSATCRN